MKILNIQLKNGDRRTTEVCYRVDNELNYQSQCLDLETIQDLLTETVNDAEHPPDLVALGQRLFSWLDGSEKCLSHLLEQGQQDDLLVLGIDGSQQFSFLPWEILHNGQHFLVDSINPMILPVRWSVHSILTETPSPRIKRLQVLWMAASPEGLEPIVPFEDGENQILQATTGLDLDLQIEESGGLSELSNRWGQLGENFDVFHLSGHVLMDVGETPLPYVVTESEVGEARLASAQAIAQALRFRFPSLVILSGYPREEGFGQPALNAIAEQLIERGAKAILGWGLTTQDSTTILAATHFYQRLAEGDVLPMALAGTFQYLRQQQVPDWYLLRLYGRGQAFGALVTPPGMQEWLPVTSPSLFLDPSTQRVRVANANEFVGRRRILQACLRHWRSTQGYAILLYGLDGVGKSTITARLLERSPEYKRIFIHQALDRRTLLRELGHYAQTKPGRAILNKDLPLAQQLKQFFAQGLNEPSDQLIFVLDNFEANLQERSGQWFLTRQVVPIFEALVEALAESEKAHRLIITSRYRFELELEPKLARLLFVQQVKPLQGADVIKKCRRLAAFQKNSTVDGLLQSEAKAIADGNPHLLEWLDLLLRQSDLDGAGILAAMKGKEPQLLETILAEELLAQQSEVLRQVLAWGLMFNIPVPYEVFRAVWEVGGDGDVGGEFEDCWERALAVGLIEVYEQPQTVPRYRVRNLLAGLFVLPEEQEPTAKVAAEVLFQLWWESDFKINEEQALEIHRLALLGNLGEMAVKIAQAIAIQWIDKSRYRDTVSLCLSTLELISDYRIFHQLATVKYYLGEVEEAIYYYQQAMEVCPSEDESQKAAILHHLGLIYALQGDNEKAIALYQQSLEINEKIGDLPGIASTWHELGRIYVNHGDSEKAIALYQQSLETHERMGNLPGMASNLNQMAGVYALQGNKQKAIAFYQQSLEIRENIGDLLGQATTLHNLAVFYESQGDNEKAMALYDQSLAIDELMGDIEGKATTLYCLANIYKNQGEKERAIACLQESLAIDERTRDLRRKAATLAMLGQLLVNEEESLNQCLTYLQQSLTLWQRLRSPEAVGVQAIITSIQERLAN